MSIGKLLVNTGSGDILVADTLCPVCQGNRFQLAHHKLPELRFGILDRFSILRCVRCDTHITNPLPDQSYLVRMYKKHYLPSEYAPPNPTVIKKEVAALRAGQTALLDHWRSERSTEIPTLFYQSETGQFFADCQTILDVGAYTGENMLWLIAGGWKVIGVEPNPEVASIGQELGLDIRIADLENCQFPDAAFDAAYLSYVIEHLLEPRKMLGELWRVLKPGGLLLVTTHNVHSLWRYLFGRYWINWHTPFHIYHYYPQSLRRMVEDMGYVTLYLHTRTPMFWLLLSMRAMRDDLLYRCPHKRLYDPLQPAVARWLDRLLRLEGGRHGGDCIISVFQRV